MADKHNVKKGRDIEFLDGVVRNVKPLTISQLRKFVVVLTKIRSTDVESISDEDIDNMIAAAGIILSKVDPELAEDLDKIEEAIDLEIFSQLLEVAMGNSSPEG